MRSSNTSTPKHARKSTGSTGSGAGAAKTQRAAASSNSGTRAGTGARTGTGSGKHSVSAKSGRRRKRSAKRTDGKHRFPRWKRALILIGVILIAGVIGLHLYTHPSQVDSTGYKHASQFGNTIVLNGIDVSYAQGSKINWNKVKRNGVDFVFIRAGYRDSTDGKIHKDSQFRKNIRRAKRAGLMVGVYFYSQATTKSEAAKEARTLLRWVKGYDIDLPLVIDYEILENGRLHQFLSKDSYTKTKGTEIVKRFCEVIRNAGYEPGVYSNYDLLTGKLNSKELAKNAHIWVAHYDSSTDYPNKYEFWQASNQATISGVKGDADRNFWYFYKGGMTTYGKRNVNAKSLKHCTIKLKKHSFYLVGRKVEPSLTVKYGKKTLTEGKDYRLSYVKNASAGYAYAVVTGLGNYKDMKLTRFRIKTVL